MYKDVCSSEDDTSTSDIVAHNLNGVKGKALNYFTNECKPKDYVTLWKLSQVSRLNCVFLNFGLTLEP